MLPEEIAIFAETAGRLAGGSWLRAVQMESLSFAEQTRLMSRTGLLAGLEGAGFVNKLFTPRGGTTVILSPWQLATGPLDATERRAWQWAYGQYHARRLVFIDMGTRHLRNTLPDRQFARALGVLLAAVWGNCRGELPLLPGGATVAENGPPVGPPDDAVCKNVAEAG
uniref:Uncharacterized protein n=1 Tax=Haptolina brevifila TaxID=156173 RepID=A0A7S2D0J4_9EUKA|mmetsp:Transcript_31212/g.62472  ORF Transcript_31212/g.62472 Transcript_31212/m.62472 type:complete len:168 (+) Transcript_31212:715-1218(+)